MTSKYFLIVLTAIIGLIVGGVVGYALAPIISNQLGVSGVTAPTGYQNTFQDGWRAAKDKLKKFGFGPAMGLSNSISGTIKELANQKIIITVPLVNPLDDEALKQRAVAISSNTQIILRKMRSAEDIKEFQETNQAKVKKLQAEIENTKDTTAKADLQMQLVSLQMSVADIFQEVKIAFKDLKVGQAVTVEASDVIGERLEFTAVKVTAQADNLGAGMAPPPALAVPAP